jgi:uncharacterized membrane protein
VGSSWIVALLTLLAVFELVADQLPSTPSRTVPWQFGARLMTGTLSGAVVGASAGLSAAGALAGLIGAVIGTLAGSRGRARLAGAFHNDHPAALVEDVVAIGGAVAIAFAGR